MDNIEVMIDLPFYLRLEKTKIVRYEDVCREAPLPELAGHKVRITFVRRKVIIDNSDWLSERTTVAIKIKTGGNLSEKAVNRFAIRNCLEILNRVITSYHAATGNISNAGYILPLGTSDMQLFARISVNNKNVRDRWPGHSQNTFPLSNGETKRFRQYLTGQDELPLSQLTLMNSMLSLERGQYSLAVLQAAIAVELRTTQAVSKRLKALGWSKVAIQRYEDLTLGQKLNIPRTDTRSLETYFHTTRGFDSLYPELKGKGKDKLNNLRNRVAHDGYIPSREEAINAVEKARKFLVIVN